VALKRAAASLGKRDTNRGAASDPQLRWRIPEALVGPIASLPQPSKAGPSLAYSEFDDKLKQVGDN
jgi:hypothetical protein